VKSYYVVKQIHCNLKVSWQKSFVNLNRILVILKVSFCTNILINVITKY